MTEAAHRSGPHGRSDSPLMDDDRLDAIVYPTARRIAPLVGGNQLGSNAGLSAQTGFPAITVPAGFTPSGFPVGIEMLARPFSEPALVGLAYSYEQATRHRRPPSSTPRLGGTRVARAATASSPDAGAGSAHIEVMASGDVPFGVVARFNFNDRTRELGYDLAPSGPSQDQIAGVYLHRRANRPNGGVAYILAKSLKSPISGKVTLLEPEAADLKAGKCYVSAISKKSPLLSARANIVWPSA